MPKFTFAPPPFLQKQKLSEEQKFIVNKNLFDNPAIKPLGGTSIVPKDQIKMVGAPVDPNKFKPILVPVSAPTIFKKEDKK
jgi:hypothetical protein